jgi:hypothetical protein
LLSSLAVAAGDQVRRVDPCPIPLEKPIGTSVSYAADAAPDKKWVEVSDAGEAAFRNQHASTKP